MTLTVVLAITECLLTVCRLGAQGALTLTPHRERVSRSPAHSTEEQTEAGHGREWPRTYNPASGTARDQVPELLAG